MTRREPHAFPTDTPNERVLRGVLWTFVLMCTWVFLGCRPPLNATTNAGTQYLGIPGVTSAPPRESPRSVGDLLLAGYSPIGILRSTAPGDNDSSKPFREGIANARGELYTMRERNVRAESGTLRLHGHVCRRFGSPAVPDSSGVATSMMTAASHANAGMLGTNTGVCAEWMKIDQTTAMPLMASSAILWEKRADGGRGSEAFFEALRIAIVGDRHPAATGRFGDELLRLALGAGDAASLVFLLGSGKKLDAEGRVRASPALALAARGGELTQVRALLTAEVRPPLGTLQVAVARNDAEMIVALLAVPGIVDERDEKGRMALHVAIEGKSLGAVEALRAAGASFDAATPEGHTALDIAAAAARSDAVLSLLGAGAKADRAKMRPVELLARACQCRVADAVAKAGGAGAPCDDAQRTRARQGAAHFLREMRVIAAIPPLKQLEHPLPDLKAACIDFDEPVEGATLVRAALDLQHVDWAILFRNRTGELGDLRGISLSPILVIMGADMDPALAARAMRSGADPNLAWNGGVPLAWAAGQVNATRSAAEAMVGMEGKARDAAEQGYRTALARLRFLLEAGADVERARGVLVQLARSDARARALLKARGID